MLGTDGGCFLHGIAVAQLPLALQDEVGAGQGENEDGQHHRHDAQAVHGCPREPAQDQTDVERDEAVVHRLQPVDVGRVLHVHADDQHDAGDQQQTADAGHVPGSVAEVEQDEGERGDGLLVAVRELAHLAPPLSYLTM